MSRKIKLNDPVRIDSKNSSSSSASKSAPLQGIVAFLGPVSFSDGDDWVGVRLTGDSIGRGKNDGTVGGVRYFDHCATSGGVFVHRNALKVRKTSRLEQIRVKRNVKGVTKGSSAKTSAGVTKDRSEKTSADDIKSAGESSVKRDIKGVTKGSSAKTSAGVTKDSSEKTSADDIKSAGESSVESNINPKFFRPSPQTSLVSVNEDEASVQSVNSRLSSASSRSGRLDEIRKRRMALASRLSSSSLIDRPSTAPKSDTLQKKVDILTEENISLKRSLRNAERVAYDANLAKEEAQSDISLVHSQVAAFKQPPPTTPNSVSNETNPTSTCVIEHDILETKQELSTLTSTLATTHTQLTTLTDELERTQSTLTAERLSHATEISDIQTNLSTLGREFAQTTEQGARRDESNALQYKERAKLQAEVAAWKRRSEEVEKEREELVSDKEGMVEKMEGMDEILEEAMIDAESAQLEADELRLELEVTNERAKIADATMEVGGGDGATANGGEGGVTADREDVAQALSIQNSRLREAIIRLRERSSVERIELTRQLQTAENASSFTASLEAERSTLRTSESNLRIEVRELKEAVDQGTGFETMVEELSDKVMGLEDGNVALQVLLKELEEMSELNGEMEEAQDDEINALTEDVQNRDTIILNLEEAVKIQRRRELDSQRTVKNYKTANGRLHSEKAALLTLQTSSDVTQSNAISTSQKALSHVAQMVSTAAYARKKVAEASIHYVDAQYFCYLAERLESLLPIASSSTQGGGGCRMEVMGVKGELLLGKVAVKASLGLRCVGDLFEDVMQKAKPILNAAGSITEVTIMTMEVIPISENLSQHIATLVHETNFAQLAIRLSSECVKLLAMGQWPDVLTDDGSLDFGNSVVHSIVPLDSAISELLSTLQEEGSLSPHGSNLTILDEALKDVKSALLALDGGGIDGSGGGGIKSDWSPPGLALFEKISSAKFFCLGAGSLLASIVVDWGDSESSASTTDVEGIRGDAFFSSVLTQIDHMITDINNRACSEVLAVLNVMDAKTLKDIDVVVSEWRSMSEELFKSVEGFCCSGDKKLDGKKMAECVSTVDSTAHSLFKLMSLLRVSNTTMVTDLRDEEKESGNNGTFHNHPLSPETKDPWGGIIKLVRKIRNTNGDADDLNYLIRARNVEQRLTSAVDNYAKLSTAETRIVSLEKTISRRSREIGMQNSRLEELEALLSQTIVPKSRASVLKASMKWASVVLKTKASTKSGGMIPAQEIHSLKEENRILLEAMEVIQTQGDEYEREIRSLKDSNHHKSPRASKGMHSRTDSSPDKLGLGSPQHHTHSHQHDSLSLEASLFRPALRLARSDASMWKSRAINDILLKLPPLRIRANQSARTNINGSTSTDFFDELMSLRRKLILANAEVRRVKASVTITDLSNKKGEERSLSREQANRTGAVGCRRRQKQLYNEKNDEASTAILRLEEASSTARHALAQLPSRNGAVMIPRVHSLSHNATNTATRGKIFGRVSFPGEEKEEEEHSAANIIPFMMERSEIIELHSVLLQ